MGLPRSTYYDAPVATADEAEIVARIEAICEEFEAYGYRRVGAALRHQGIIVNSKKVRRLMREHDLQPRRRKRFVNIVENALGTVRQVTRNVKRWRNAEMALRWTAAGLLEAQKTFRRLKAYRQLPILRNALQEHLRKAQADSAIETIMKAA